MTGAVPEACATRLVSLVPRVLALAIVSTIALPLAPATPAAAQAHERLGLAVDSLARAAVARGEVVGLSVAVALGGDHGHGLFVDPLEGHRRIRHGGVANGFASHVAYYPDLDLAVVVLTNTCSAAAPRIEEQVARWFLGSETPATGAETF
jgi:CubicO group peptidase (beta-lactamase class C family)